MFLRLRDNSNNFVSEGLIKMMKQQRNHSLQCESRKCEHFDGGASDIGAILNFFAVISVMRMMY